MMTSMPRRLFVGATVLVLGLAGVACRAAEDRIVPEVSRQRGIDLLQDTGQRLAAGTSFSFATHETGERVRRSGAKEPVAINQTVRVRRPDRLHVKADGDLDLEVVYDGANITLLSHKEKVYGVVPASGSLATVIHETMDRFDIPFPLGDIVAFTSARALVSDATTGGWVGDETVRGQRAHKLAWQHPDVDWTLWVAADGDRLPLRLELVYQARRGTPRRAFDFTDWQLGVEHADGLFVARVPDDYEGIPVIQRASAVLADEEPAAPEKEN